MTFWIIAALIGLATGAMLAGPLLRRGGDTTGDSDDQALGIYRDQLAEVDRDLARGVLAPQDADRTRTEISRRLLSADKTGVAPVSDGPVTLNRVLALLAVLAVAGGGIGLYARLGAPGYPDISLQSRLAAGDALRENRGSQSDMEAQAATLPRPPIVLTEDEQNLVTQLRQVVAANPDQVQGWIFLANVERDLENYPAAARAQNEVIRLKADTATTDDYGYLLDLMVAATLGQVSPEAEQVIRILLGRDEKNATGLYYLGLLYAQTDRPDIAFRLWRQVVEGGDIDTIHVQLARAQIEEAAMRAGADYTLPPERGPTAADIANSADMAPEDRDAMIRGMVAQLSDRLASEGGSAGDWARLITAYGVLGETARATEILLEARDVFAASPADVALIDDAARQAGITP